VRDDLGSIRAHFFAQGQARNLLDPF